MSNHPDKLTSVALLLNNIGEAKNVSDVLRKFGIVAHFYEDLLSFWDGVLENTPSLSIVDVNSICQEDVHLKNHPYVKSEELPIVFFYNEDSQNILSETNDLFNFGLIKQSENYESKINAVIKRLSKVTRIETAKKNLELENDKLNLQFEKLVVANERFKEKDYYSNLLKSFTNHFELQRGAEDFISAFGNVLGNLKEVTEFTAFELNPSGQKLISLNSRHKKFKKLPALWLGQTCEHGIEIFAQNLISQIILDLMGGDLMSLNIKGIKENPDVIIFLKISNQDFLNGLDWEALEKAVNGSFNYFNLRDQGHGALNNQSLAPWELLSFVDQFSFGKTLSDKSRNISEDEYSLIHMDFSDLTYLVRSQRKNRFFWQDFYHDFFGKLQASVPAEFQTSSFGVNTVAVLVAKEDTEMIFNKIKSYSSKYPYWRMFENVDFTINESVRPSVRMSPFSTEAFLQMTEQDELNTTEEIKEIEVSSKNKDIIWGRSPEQSM